MPFDSGTAETPTILMKAINDHLVANSWTKLRGNTDLQTDSPVSARYWRVLIVELQTGSADFHRIARCEFRTTVGGANVATTAGNFSFSSSLGDGTAANLIDGSSATWITSVDINDDAFWIKYDFGSATTVRQILLGNANSVQFAPAEFFIQWSTDDITWTTMRHEQAQSWTVSENKTYDFGDTYRFSGHYDENAPRKSGAYYDITGLTEQGEDVWMWQGPGYDAARRVYVGVRGYYDLVNASTWLEWSCFTDYNSSVPGVGEDQEGAHTETVKHTMNDEPVDYWIYSNSLRLILITKSGINNYHSTYIGFMAAFAAPDEYPFPLLMSSTQSDFSIEGVENARISSMTDPGDDASWARKWDNTWVDINNRPNSGESDLYEANPNGWSWPYHPGTNGGGFWPNNCVGTTTGGGVHWMDRMVDTEQNDLPLIPVIIMDRTYGNLGAMDGVYAIPSSGVLTPQQVITIDSQDYRIFPNIQRRGGNDFFAVRED